jgi:hypothetical protein
MTGTTIACECDEDEYLPCEEHSRVLVQREGASLRTGDALALIFVQDVLAEFSPQIALNPLDQEFLAHCEECLTETSDAWLYPDDSERLWDLSRLVEQALPTNVISVWNDGYLVVEILSGSPLYDTLED